MKVLAIDTCGQSLSLCLDDGRKRRSKTLAGGPRRDDVLFAACEKLLKKAGLRIDELEALIAATGPGSFTGIRVGLTFASILAESLGRPAAGVSRFEAVASRAIDRKAPCAAVVFHGAREEFFFQPFELEDGAPRPLAEPAVVQPADWPALFRKSGCRALAGPAAPAAARLVKAEILEDREPSAEDALAPGLRRLAQGRLELAPLYIKPAYYERGLAAKR